LMSALSSLPLPVIPHLYIGDKKLAADKDLLLQLGITHIVNVTTDIRHYFQENEEDEKLEENQQLKQQFTYLRCPCCLLFCCCDDLICLVMIAKLLIYLFSSVLPLPSSLQL